MTTLLTQDVAPPSQSYLYATDEVIVARRGPPRKHLPVGTICGKRVVIESGLVVLHRNSWQSACRVRCDGCGSEDVIANTLLKDPKVKTCGCGEHQYKPDSDWQQVLAFLRYTARSRRKKPIEFALSLSQVKGICSKPCAYCKLEPSNVLCYKKWVTKEAGERVRVLTDEIQLRYSGIDRLDSSKGYYPGNVVPCCKFCNFAKQDSSLGEFLARLARFGSQLQAADIHSLATLVL